MEAATFGRQYGLQLIVSKTLKKLYGDSRKQLITMPVSRYDRPVTKVETGPIVENADFASLDVGECYVKIRSAWPEGMRIIV